MPQQVTADYQNRTDTSVTPPMAGFSMAGKAGRNRSGSLASWMSCAGVSVLIAHCLISLFTSLIFWALASAMCTCCVAGADGGLDGFPCQKGTNAGKANRVAPDPVKAPPCRQTPPLACQSVSRVLWRTELLFSQCFCSLYVLDGGGGRANLAPLEEEGEGIVGHSENGPPGPVRFLY